MRKILFLLVMAGLTLSIPVRVAVIRGYHTYSWNTIARDSYIKAKAMAEEVDGIDIILFPEFAFAGIDGSGHSRPEVFFTYDSTMGFVTNPLSSTDPNDILTAIYLDSVRYLAISETCYVWASSCGEVIDGENFNCIPIFGPDGRIIRFRRKIWSGSSHSILRDSTVHLDSIYTKSGGRIAVMTTICYENSSLAGSLDPVDPPAPLWLLPHGTWSAAGYPEMTYITQRWVEEPEEITLSGVWSIPRDNWVREDAILISCDIFGTEWTAMRIDNYGASRQSEYYEPISWVEEHDDYVVVDINVPEVADSLPVLARSNGSSNNEKFVYFDRLTALPQISSGEIFIHGTESEIQIYDVQGKLVDELIGKYPYTLWDGHTAGKFPVGIYLIESNGQTDTIQLID